MCDDQVALATEAFADAELILLPSDEIDHATLRKVGAEALIVRSTVRVDESLLGDLELEFVGTATVGSDHVDRAFLRRRNIDFADAAGSSAPSVAEFTWAMIIQAAARRGLDLSIGPQGTSTGLSLGVVGVGAIGSRVAAIAEALGFEVFRVDPPRAALEGPDGFAPPESLAGADIVSLHLPLTNSGDHPTQGLVDRAWLAALPEHALLVNTGRGAVVDSKALIEAVETGRIGGCALDVFQGEPAIDRELQKRCLLMTPHVAGRSLEGLVANTVCIARTLRERAGRDGMTAEIVKSLPSAGPLPALERPDLAECLETVWGLEALDGELRLPGDGDGRNTFKSLRNLTPLRRDLRGYERRGDEPDAFGRFLDALAASTPCD